MTMTNNGTTRNIMVSLCGLYPQLITETLYALTQQGIRIDEIRVITTREGLNKINKLLLTDVSNQQGKFYEFCRDFNIEPTSITFSAEQVIVLKDGNQSDLDDIRTKADNINAGNQICEVVRMLTQEDQNTKLFVSAAGGRKTMSIYLTAAMQLFGREMDTLSHVLVNEEFEMLADFFYPPTNVQELHWRDRQTGELKSITTDKAKVELADIPFIRLRPFSEDWLDNDKFNYSDMVRKAQEKLYLQTGNPEIYINRHNKTVIVDGYVAKLTEREFFYYVLFAQLRKENKRDSAKNGFIELLDITRDDVNDTLKFITSVREEPCDLENYSSEKFRFAADLVKNITSYLMCLKEGKRVIPDQLSTKIKKSDQSHTIKPPLKLIVFRDKLANQFSQAISKLNDKLAKNGLPKKYQIISEQKDQKYVCYGLKVESERINFPKIDNK